MNTVEQDNEITRAKEIGRIRERSRIFVELFQTPQGKIVLESLHAKFAHSLPPNVLDNHGRTDPYQTWRRLGHFDVLAYIEAQLTYKESNV